MMRIDILTLFPEMLESTLETSIVKRAQVAGQVEIFVHDIRDWADNKHRTVDDRPFGSGPGLVMMCQPLHDAVLAVERQSEISARRVYFTPQGEVLKQERVEQLDSGAILTKIKNSFFEFGSTEKSEEPLIRRQTQFITRIGLLEEEFMQCRTQPETVAFVIPDNKAGCQHAVACLILAIFDFLGSKHPKIKVFSTLREHGSNEFAHIPYLDRSHQYLQLFY